jgi:uncharacterized protein YndB with AHSA1/START domain
MENPIESTEHSPEAALLQHVFEEQRPSPDSPDMVRVVHAECSVTLESERESFFSAFTQFDRYEDWAPDVQGSAHWLSITAGAIGSRFICYDKPGTVHFAHFGTVEAYEPNKRFSWRAPFGEWQRAFIGSTLELSTEEGGHASVTERIFFDVHEEHLPILAGFLQTDGFDRDTFEAFLEARLSGLDALVCDGHLPAVGSADSFTEDRRIAEDWAGRISEGEWVRVLYADGEVDWDAPIEDVFNAFTRFARYADWTRRIHVGAEWYEVREGGVGSKFMIWEKVGDRHVMHYAGITELERNRKFAWRAPFAEWGKVFVGTALTVEPREDGGTHAYHVLYVDIPVEYLPVFGGFGTLPGFDMEFETHHIYEEAAGFGRLIEEGEFTEEETSYLFDEDRTLARDWPLQEGRRWPEETLTLEPDRIITYEEMLVELSKTFAESIPSPRFSRTYRDLDRTRRYNFGGGDR